MTDEPRWALDPNLAIDRVRELENANESLRGHMDGLLRRMRDMQKRIEDLASERTRLMPEVPECCGLPCPFGPEALLRWLRSYQHDCLSKKEYEALRMLEKAEAAKTGAPPPPYDE